MLNALRAVKESWDSVATTRFFHDDNISSKLQLHAGCKCSAAGNHFVRSTNTNVHIYTNALFTSCTTTTKTNGPLYKSALHVFSSTDLLKTTVVNPTPHLSPRQCSPHSAASASSTRLEPRGKDHDETLHVPSTRGRQSMTNLGVVKIFNVFTCRRSMADFAFSARQLIV